MKRIAIVYCVFVLVVVGLAGAATVSSSTAPSAVTEGQTLGADPSTMVNTAKAVSLIDQGKSALCKTTVSGVTYFSNPSAYVVGQWHNGLSALTLGQALSTDKTTFDTAGNSLMRTTITGKRYCSHPSKWTRGYWAIAFPALRRVRAYLVANPATDGPSIFIK